MTDIFNSIKGGQHNWFKHNPKKIKCLILFLSFLLAIWIAENLIQSTEPPEDTFIYKRFIRLREWTPFIDTIFTPDENLVNTNKLVKKGYRFRTDRNGFIMPSEVHKNPDLSIVFLGGSTTESGFVDEKKRFPYLVGRIIEERTGKKVNSYNSGRSMNHSLHALNILVNKIVPMHPDIVVLMENVNDLHILIRGGERGYWSNLPHRSLIMEEKDVRNLMGIKNLVRWIIPKLYYHLTDLRRWLMSLWGRTNSQPDLSEKKSFLVINQEKQEKYAGDFRNSLQAFVGVAKAMGIQPVLMTQASRFTETPDPILGFDGGDIDYSTYKKAYDRFNDVIREVGEANDIMVIDLDKVVPKTGEYMYDSVHFNDHGSVFVSNVISEHLMQVVRAQN